MNRNEIEAAIAKDQGWYQITKGDFEGLWKRKGIRVYHSYHSDYLADINACAEFESRLTDEEWERYIRFPVPNDLDWIGGKRLDYFGSLPKAWRKMASARPLQRCEAYLRVKGLWRD